MLSRQKKQNQLTAATATSSSVVRRAATIRTHEEAAACPPATAFFTPAAAAGGKRGRGMTTHCYRSSPTPCDATPPALLLLPSRSPSCLNSSSIAAADAHDAATDVGESSPRVETGLSGLLGLLPGELRPAAEPSGGDVVFSTAASPFARAPPPVRFDAAPLTLPLSEGMSSSSQAQPQVPCAHRA